MTLDSYPFNYSNEFISTFIGHIALLFFNDAQIKLYSFMLVIKNLMVLYSSKQNL